MRDKPITYTASKIWRKNTHCGHIYSLSLHYFLNQTLNCLFALVAEYDETFKLQIDRKSRSFARIVERKGIKLDVYIKRSVHTLRHLESEMLTCFMMLLVIILSGLLEATCSK